jgi:hypothetical protein
LLAVIVAHCKFNSADYFKPLIMAAAASPESNICRVVLVDPIRDKHVRVAFFRGVAV